MIAIFENRGKQYKAKIGDFLKLPKLSELKKNDSVTFDKVIFMKDDKGQNNLVTLSSEEVKGGFPCFEKNLPIEDSTDNTYLLKFRFIGQSTLIHSMKWSDDASNKEMDRDWIVFRSVTVHGNMTS